MKATKNSIENLSTLSGTISDAYLVGQQFSKALEFQTERLKIAQQLENKDRLTKAYIALIQIHCRKGDVVNAEKCLKEAKTLVGLENPRLLFSEGMIFAQKSEWGKAILCYQKLLGKPTKDEDTLLINNNLGCCYIRDKQYSKAEECLKRAIVIVDKLMGRCIDTRQVSYFDIHSRSYHMLIDALVSQGKLREALVIADRAKSIALNNSIKKEAKITTVPPRSYEDFQRIAKENNSSFIHYTFSFFEKNTLFIWFVPQTGKVVFKKTKISPPKELSSVLRDIVKCCV